MIEQTTRGAISPSTGRTLPDRYIEGTCPICGFAEARGDQCDNCGNQLDADELINPRSKINGETPEFIETQHFFLDLPALAGALGEWLDGREASGTWRPNVIKFSQEPPQGRAPARDDARHRLGHPDPARGLGGRTRPSGSTSGSTPSSATSRRRSSGPAASGDAGALAGVVERPGGGVLLLPGQGQHHLPQPDLAGRAARLRRQGRQGRRAGGVRRAEPPDRGRGVRVHDARGQAVLDLAQARHLRAGHRRALRPRPDPLLHLRRRPGEPGRRLHAGPSSSSATTASSSPAGATSSTAPPR